MRIRLIVPLTSCLLAACSGAEPDEPIDTTLTEKPKVERSATISGELGFPSDYIPKDMQVCAETATGTTMCEARIDTDKGLYSVKVPAGTYRVYSKTAQEPGEKAYYTKFVTCGMDVSCTSHEPIAVTVAAGETRTGVHPTDWYDFKDKTVAGEAKAEPKRETEQEDWSPSEAAIIASWYDYNEKCRGGMGTDAATDAACAERDGPIAARLIAADICYGREGEYGYQMRMHRCAADSLR